MQSIHYLVIFQYEDLTDHFDKLIGEEACRKSGEDILVEGPLMVFGSNTAFPVLLGDATLQPMLSDLGAHHSLASSRLDGDSDFPMDADEGNDDVDHDHGDQDMQFSHTRSQAAADTPRQSVLLTLEKSKPVP
jgi:hypothetical protein